ncbi:unnamed protein product [Adineta steineri]|uniref:Uncharacterized protein n=1 Tax=Adineta steineri TaxID=433720 RepID=A0A813MEH2_9BILA|nr:unnamed protein product [Adineta steineri]CAF0890420.1 unnamed protein product [Adineta steineri]
MQNNTSLTANELRETSNVNHSVILSSCSEKNQSLKSWIGSIQRSSWGNLCDCIKHMVEYGCNMEHSLSWVQDILEGISLSPTRAQLNYIFNGYADLYKIVIYIICVTDNVPVNLEKDIRRYDGTSSESEQEKRCRNITFIMCKPETFSFAILYATDSDDKPQTCFARDDQRIFDHLRGLFEKLNQESKLTKNKIKVYILFIYSSFQISVMETELSIDNNDATLINTEEPHTTDNVNAHLSSSLSSSENDSSSDIHSKGSTDKLSVESGDDSTTSEKHEDHIIYNSQTNSHFNLYSTDEEPMTNSTTNIQNISSDMDAIIRDMRQELNSAEESPLQTTQIDCHQKNVDNTSVETNDCRMNLSVDLKERESITKNIIHHTKQHTIRKAKTKHVRSSNNNSISIPVILSDTTTKTASVVVSDVQSAMAPIIKYGPPNIRKQPNRYRRVRMLKDLLKKMCPLVQAGDKHRQRAYPEIELPTNADNNAELYVRVRAVTEGGHSHSYQCVAPEKLYVNISSMGNNNQQTYLQSNSENECVFLKTTDKERRERRKILEYTLCEQSTSGEYQLVSQPSYTSIIELMDKEVTIDDTEVKPRQLCQLSGGEISVPLSTKCKKSDFYIECDGQELKSTQYKMEGKKLIIISPASKSNNELHLTILKKEYNEGISKNQMNTLYDDFIPYVVHGQCTHTCSSCN